MSLPAVVSTETLGANLNIALKSLVLKSASFWPETTSMEIGTSCSFCSRFWAVTITSPTAVSSAASTGPAHRLTSIVVENRIRAIIAASPSLLPLSAFC